ncbi:MAG: sugar ABC transporter permease [Eubacteriales bacterium]|nr:sugar ABC transporter permease [Eubacteriales bacterium]MDD4134701.1 sugar ABC transporter permease [Eubacteriales bacterium]
MEPYLFLLPAFVVFGLFLFYPFGRTIFLSTFLTDKLGNARVFWGVRNYTDLFTSSSFWASVGVTFQFVAIVAFGGLLIGLATSLLTAKKYPGVTFASASYAMPVAIASAAASMAFRMILHPTNGLLNILFGTQINWTGDPRWALFSVSMLTIWLASGINFIFISAGLRGVPDEMYESASIDGAGYWRRLFSITLPSISPTLFFQIIINIIGAFQSFSQIRLLTQGGPGDATNVIVYAIYRDAFYNFRFGTAAARSIILFAIVLVITLIQFSFEKRSVHY